jgi:ectoine hydroxylase
MMNIAIFLDDVNAGSGELIVIPGSHTEFLEREEENKSTKYSIDGSASSDLLFNFTDKEIEFYKDKMGSQNIVGPKGTVLAFDANIIHGSGNSLENQSRKLLILTFNSCENLPTAVSERPEYLCSKDHQPIVWR